MSDQTFGISGFVAPGFEPVRAAFEANFNADLELGAGFCLWLEGACVVDLHGGWTDRKRERPWQASTLVPVYSTTKPIAAMIVARTVELAGDRLPLGYETPVAEFWPEFASAGKAAYTIAEVLSHQAGIPGFPEPIDPALWLDPPALSQALAGLAPMWPRGEGSGYHPLTWGYLAGEIARRLDPQGRTLGTILRQDVTHPADRADPIDFYIGLPEAEHVRVAELMRPRELPALGPINPFNTAAFLTTWAAPDRGGAEWRSVEIPSANGIGTARAVARLYSFFAGGLSADGLAVLTDPGVRDAFLRLRVSGYDRVLPFNLSFAAGVMRNGRGVYGPNPGSFGHSGWGGSMALGDPDNHLACAYVMNRQTNQLQSDLRGQRLVSAVYDCL